MSCESRHFVKAMAKPGSPAIGVGVYGGPRAHKGRDDDTLIYTP